MSTQHTPAPWDDKHICDVRMQPNPTEMYANLALINAAPELLEAAQLTLLHFQRNQASDNFQGDDEHEAWTALRNAIAKATGDV